MSAGDPGPPPAFERFGKTEPPNRRPRAPEAIDAPDEHGDDEDPPPPAVGEATPLSIEDIVEVRRVATAVGGIAILRAALDFLDEIRRELRP